MEQCKLPPPGWRCTRETGHEGPCYAYKKEKYSINIGLIIYCLLLSAITILAYILDNYKTRSAPVLFLGGFFAGLAWVIYLDRW